MKRRDSTLPEIGSAPSGNRRYLRETTRVLDGSALALTPAVLTPVPTLGSASRRRAGRYVLGDLIGRGGMAEVFAGRALGSHGFQKPVAIKRLLPELATDDVFVSRLIAEAKLVVGMQHGNLVSVIDLAREDDDVFLVMEYVDGPSLRELLRARPRPLPIGIATHVVMAAAAGIGHAHGRGIIHADISPSNLLLATSGEVRVADFGIARKVGHGHGMVEGKWAYMPPEQARGEALTPAADVFSLGIVLFELLAGRHPFVPSAGDPADNHAPRRMSTVRAVRPEVPPALEAIVERCLAYDPSARLPTMHDVIEAIDAVRFAHGLRDGATELAAVIATTPRGDARAPSQRNLLIQTASLLRPADGTPARGIGSVAADVTPTTVDVPDGPVRPSLAEFRAVLAGAPVRPLPIAQEARRRRMLGVVAALVALVIALAAVARCVEPDAGAADAPARRGR
jgi:serine/threonine-protein kinase